ncbi:DUF2721 domain-containing protein [Cyanobium sp. NIES-981]|uniref:DUF2721 domain-containing protein n=1 Tax=Cyanobium sp. NIES-981 TaxID=1851505 RepID=UPI0007DE0B43|nr:DUF2721 domain-containing protein [Cyanobium sp. NIES-981]SBO43375.1 conserved protein of unknown function [Cyanobium sp. NIES-981]
MFLPTGIAGLLNIFTGRLARIIDRTQVLQQALDRDSAGAESPLHRGIQVQRRRLFLTNRAILLVMLALIGGLLLFLLEVQLAIRQNPRKYY